MRQIDEKIKWLELNATRKDDDLIRVKLKMINELFKEIEYSEDRIFMEEIIEAFLGIMDIQRGVIFDLQTEMEAGFEYTPGRHSFVAGYTQPEGGFRTDKQLQAAFATYLTSKGKSTYTINDYCSRIKNIWKLFCDDKKIPADSILPDQPLVNAFRFSDELKEYVSDKLECAEKKRHLANSQSAMRRLHDFKCSLI